MKNFENRWSKKITDNLSLLLSLLFESTRFNSVAYHLFQNHNSRFLLISLKESFTYQKERGDEEREEKGEEERGGEWRKGSDWRGEHLAFPLLTFPLNSSSMMQKLTS